MRLILASVSTRLWPYPRWNMAIRKWGVCGSMT